MPPRWTLFLLSLLVALGASLRVWQARESLWVDELHTAWCAGSSLAEVAPRAQIGNQSPLFFWLEWLLVQIGGASEWTLRLPSLLAGTVLPAALFGLAWQWTRSNLVALVAAALVVVDPRSIFYATEARPYALVELLAAVHIAIFAELLARPTTRLRIAFILGAALLFHLHYTAALLILAEVAFWLLAAAIDRQGVAYRLAPFAMDLFFLAALATPATWNVLAIAGRRENWAAVVKPQPAYTVLTLLPWSVLLLFVLVDVDAFLRTATEPDEKKLLVVMAWLLVPVAAAWLLTELSVAYLFSPRYLAASAPAAMLLAALVVRLPPWPQTRITLALTLLAIGLWSSAIIPQFRQDGRFIADRREDWRSAIGWLNQQLPTHPLPVLVRSGLIESDVLRGKHKPLMEDYCVLPVTSLYRLQARRADLAPLPYRDAGRLEPDVRRLVDERGGLWLVNRSGEKASASVERRLIASLEAAEARRPGGRKWRVVESKSFGNVQIRRIARTSET
jgi:hypothetical protein